MDKSDNVGMLASSLASVIRQSLDAAFRKECFLLLGVTNNLDAQDAIYSLLKSRDVQKNANNMTQDPLSHQPTLVEERGELMEKLESAVPMDTQNENSTIGSESLSEPSNHKGNADHADQCPPHTMKAIEANIEKSSQSEDISDDETQLDWDTDTKEHENR